METCTWVEEVVIEMEEVKTGEYMEEEVVRANEGCKLAGGRGRWQ